MGRSCCVPGCTSNYGRSSHTTIFKFPKEQLLKEKWIKSIHRANFEFNDKTVVCIKHFLPKFVIREDIFPVHVGEPIRVPRKYPKLTNDAYPTIFPNLPSHPRARLSNVRKYPKKHKKRVLQRNEKSFSELDEQDVITCFNSFKSEVKKRQVHPFITIAKEDYVLFIKIDDDKYDDIPSMSISFKVSSNLKVSVFYKDLCLPVENFSSILECSGSKELKCDRWSKLNNMCQHIINECSYFEKGNVKLELKEEPQDHDTYSHALTVENVDETCYAADNAILEKEIKGQKAVDIMKEEITIENSDFPCSGPGAHVEDLSIYTDNSFTTFNDDVLESTNNTKKQSFTCIFCNSIFTDTSSFQEHLLIHKPKKKKYKCMYSVKGFIQVPALRNHILIHESKNMRHEHEICGKSFSQLPKVKKHFLNYEAKKPHKCEVCAKSFAYASILRKHLLIHEDKKSHKCEICGKGFIQASSLQQHLSIHEGKKLYMCEYCGKSFTTAFILRGHLLTHEGKKPHMCEFCGKNFSQSSYLRGHLLIHEGKKPYKCEVCRKSFSHPSNLRRHLLIHEGKKPHKCEICGKSFTQASNLRKHLLIHEGNKPYKCEVCEKSFSHPSNLRKHLLIH